MQGTTTYLNMTEMATVFSIHPYTLELLVDKGIIPHTYMQEQGLWVIKFNPYVVAEWMKGNPDLSFDKAKPSVLKEYYEKTYPETIKKLKGINAQVSPKRVFKYYSLQKVKNKRYGFLYYVRYSRNGKMIRSRWNTHTNNLPLAEKFAEENREKILSAYDASKKPEVVSSNLYKILGGYYHKDSLLLADDIKRGRVISEDNRKQYHNFINKTLIPFLKSRGVHTFSDITPPLVSDFQSFLLHKGLKNQSVNRNISGIRMAFDLFIRKNMVPENVFRKITSLKIIGEESRGCFDIDLLTGIFSSAWENEFSYLLCLLIYTTGMRNDEIERLCLTDIITIDNYLFIDLTKSKTPNGIRLVPIHPFVYEKLIGYTRRQKKEAGEYIFFKNGKAFHSDIYKDANLALGRELGLTESDLEKENITFYSGRHFWKTLMNANRLDDVEEYFMGHKVSSRVAERYNHRDKQGRKMLAKKAKQVYSILEKTLLKRSN